MQDERHVFWIRKPTDLGPASLLSELDHRQRALHSELARGRWYARPGHERRGPDI
jgi:hypothetical protein